MSEISSGLPLYEQSARRQSALKTPFTFSQDITTGTTIYPGKANEFFLIRAFSVSNTTTSDVNLTVTVGGETWATSVAIPASSVVPLEGMKDQLIEDGIDILGTGTGLTVFGWGLRIRGGGEDWIL